MRVLVTGGSGFIGTHLVKMLLGDDRITHVANVDKLTYASNHYLDKEFESNPKYSFHQVDIGDASQILEILKNLNIDHVLNLAAESHVDNSIDNSSPFVITNVLGTVSLLDAFKTYVGHKVDKHKFIHISTDEVFGSLKLHEEPFTEYSPLQPRNPYSASKASAEHFVRAYANTFGLNTNITNCSNNFGRYQNSEKLIPTIIRNFVQGKSVPVYGNGKNVRDWVYVGDHCRALINVLIAGYPGETYCIGGGMEMSNIQMVMNTYGMLVKLGYDVKEDIQFIMDRKGHDLRYAISDKKIWRTLGDYKRDSFWHHMEDTVKWYASQYK